MGYTLHITRRENWFDDDVSKAITLEEWKNYVANDFEMRLDGSAEAQLKKKQRKDVGSFGNCS